MIGNIKQFASDVQKEMKKVSWPTKEQLKESTMVVLATCFIITMLVFGIDSVMNLIINFIF